MSSFLKDIFGSIVPTVKAEEEEPEVIEVIEEVEEEEEEPEDVFPVIQEECAESKLCHPFKHHFDECVERVTKAQEEDGYEELEHKEDCVEEFFHLQHCVNECAAPKLFAQLK
ncbi:ubiquinol-cytochrome C reductase hinge domain-containing protein [Dipodascopsis uninucleata]